MNKKITDNSSSKREVLWAIIEELVQPPVTGIRGQALVDLAATVIDDPRFLSWTASALAKTIKSCFFKEWHDIK